jgi:hypothetical protein
MAWRTSGAHAAASGIVRRSARRAGFGLASVLSVLFVLIPLRYSNVGTHVARPPVEEIDRGDVHPGCGPPRGDQGGRLRVSQCALRRDPVTAGTAVFGGASPPERLIDQVDEIAPRAMFLISTPSADPDEERFNRAYYRAAGGPKALWEVRDAGHVGAQDAHPLEYERRVTRFLDRALLD